MSDIEVINLNDPEGKARSAAGIRHANAPAAAEVYMHRGMWVADCPYPNCYSCERLDAGQTTFHCAECLWIGEAAWPTTAKEIDAVMNERPVPGTRNWAPAGHRQAIACGFPDGQTVADLRDENAANL